MKRTLYLTRKLYMILYNQYPVVCINEPPKGEHMALSLYCPGEYCCFEAREKYDNPHARAVNFANRMAGNSPPPTQEAKPPKAKRRRSRSRSKTKNSQQVLQIKIEAIKPVPKQESFALREKSFQRERKKILHLLHRTPSIQPAHSSPGIGDDGTPGTPPPEKSKCARKGRIDADHGRRGVGDWWKQWRHLPNLLGWGTRPLYKVLPGDPALRFFAERTFTSKGDPHI
jgi:hypothetical protein